MIIKSNPFVVRTVAKYAPLRNKEVLKSHLTSVLESGERSASGPYPLIPEKKVLTRALGGTELGALGKRKIPCSTGKRTRFLPLQQI